MKYFYNFLNQTSSEDPPAAGASPDTYSDTECILTLELTESDIPILFSQAIQDGKVLEHPDLQQQRQIPAMERDPDLEMIVPVGSDTDPNSSINSAHVLAPMFQKASLNDEATLVSSKVI